MAQSNNYIIVHADEKRFLTVATNGRIAWTYKLDLATRFSQSRALNELCRHGLSASEEKYSEVKARLDQGRAANDRSVVTPQPPVVLRLIEGTTIKYLYRLGHSGRYILSLTSLARNARKFKTFEEAQEFIRKHRHIDLRIEKMMAVHENVAHVAENVLNQRPSSDSRIQQVVKQFNAGEGEYAPNVCVRVWTLPNARSKTGLTQVVTVDTTSQMTQLEAWTRLRKIYGLKVAFPISCSEYTGKEAQQALKLAQDMAPLKI